MRKQSDGGIDETSDEDSDLSSTGSFDPVPSTTQETLNSFYEAWKREVYLKKQNEFASPARSNTSFVLVTDVKPNALNVRSEENVQYTNKIDPSVLQDDTVSFKSTSDTPEDSNLKSLGLFASSTIQSENKDQARAHISDLPRELLLRVFRWAVGDHLDTRILGKLACVCRAFHSLAYEPSLWRAVCFRQWPVLAHMQTMAAAQRGRKFTRLTPQVFGYLSWHEMAIQKPHILFDGCYLCRISYVRMGEATFSDFYRPVHLVVYYRGIRFHTDGRVEMLTSPSEPRDVVSALGKSVKGGSVARADPDDCANAPNESGSSMGGLLQGRYMWEEPNVITCILQRPIVRENMPTFRRYRHAQRPITVPSEVTFTIRFRLTSSKRRLHNVLNWESYVIDTANSVLQTRTSTELDVSSNHFPPCYYSRVRSYTRQVSTEPV